MESNGGTEPIARGDRVSAKAERTSHPYVRRQRQDKEDPDQNDSLSHRGDRSTIE